MTSTATFASFGRTCSGRVVSSDRGGDVLIQARNPHGGHNLVLCYQDESDGALVAYRHGTGPSLCAASEPLRRRGLRFLARRGVAHG